MLSSGGSRCNLTTTLDAKKTAAHFGAARNFITPALLELTPQQVRSHFESLGVATKVEPEFEKVFPASDSALQVRNALERDAKEAGARFRLNSEVTGIEPHEGGWIAHTPSGNVRCRFLLVCVGGKSFPRTGTTGDGYVWLRDLGLKVADPVPALVPLSSPAPWVHELAGTTVDGELKIGKHRRRRPVLFTHKGLSGPGPMDLSEQVTRGGAREARLDLLPEISWERVRNRLIEAAGRAGSPRLASCLPLSRRLVAAVAQNAGCLDPNPRANQIDKASRHRIVDELKGLRIPISGSLGFAKAEVTAGGLRLKELDRRTMRVYRAPGLYAFGEILDLTGPIGGFNFQAAFATAELAARGVAAEVA